MIRFLFIRASIRGNDSHFFISYFNMDSWQKFKKIYSDADKILLTFALNISTLGINTTTKFPGQFFESQKMHAMELENGSLLS